MDWRWAPGGPGMQQEAQRGMAGYSPVQAPTYRAGKQQQPAYNVNDYGQSLRNASEIAGLRSEYERNQARIAEIETALAQMDKEWEGGAGQRSRGALNGLDLALARSSARHGNMDRAFNHLTRIDSRNLGGGVGGDSDNRNRIRELVTELENAYIMRNGEESATVQAGWDNKISRLEKEYRELTGNDYEYSGASADSKVYGAGDEAVDMQSIRSKLTTMKGMRKDGRLTNAQIAELKADASSLPNGPEKNSILADIYSAEKDSAEKADAEAAKAKARRLAAAKSLTDNWDDYRVSLGKTGDSVEKTVDGITFKITYAGIEKSTGRKKYNILYDGKIVKTYYEE